MGVTCTYGTKPGARHEFWGSFPRPRNYVPVGLWGSVLGKPIKFWVLILLKSPNGGHLGLRYRRPTFLIDIQQMTSPLLVSAEVCDLLIAFSCSCVNVVRRGGQRPTSPASSTVSYERDDFAVIQYGPTSCDNGDTRHHQHVRPLSQNLIWPPSNDKLTTPSSTLDRCPQPTSGPACFQAGGQCPLNAASHHCRRCSAALRTISQSVCCRPPASCSGDVTSASDLTSATSGVSHVTDETECAPECDGSQDTTESGQSQQQPSD